MLDSLSRGVERLNDLAHHVATVVLVLLMLGTVGDVVMRGLFDRPLVGTFELTQLAIIVIVYLSVGYAEQHDAHIKVDLVVGKLRGRVRLAVLLIARLVTIAVAGMLAWRLLVFSGSLGDKGVSTSVLGYPLWPFALIAAAGALLYVLTLIVGIGRDTESSGGNSLGT
jgi:TRAP-type C4-dicarboxylate transport system permease small subunit